MRLRALIVDDERLARQKLLTLLSRRPDVEVLGECADGAAALREVARLQPDVVFLDVRMPGLSGAEVARALPAGAAPQVVFVTAHADHAVEAFEVEAVDYLLKPFDAARLGRALARVQRRREEPAEALRRLDRLVARLEEQVGEPAGELPRGSSPVLPPRPHVAAAGAPPPLAVASAEEEADDPAAATPGSTAPLDRLALRIDGRTVLLRPAEVDWIEAVGNYVRVHARGARYLHREALAALERRLQASGFVRIHRGTLVNLQRIREIQPGVGDDPVVLLADGTRLVLSRRYRPRLRALGVPV